MWHPNNFNCEGCYQAKEPLRPFVPIGGNRSQDPIFPFISHSILSNPASSSFTHDIRPCQPWCLVPETVSSGDYLLGLLAIKLARSSLE
eukprot:g31348.t1